MTDSDIVSWRPGVEPRNEMEVKELLDSIRTNNGYVSEEVRGDLQTRYPAVLSAIASLKAQLSSSILQYVLSFVAHRAIANWSDCQRTSILGTIALFTSLYRMLMIIAIRKLSLERSYLSLS